MKEKFSRIFEAIKDFVTDPKNRRYIIGGAVLLAALIIILCSVLGKRPIENIDTDCRYPYAFSANDRGATVTVSGPFAEGAVWGIENSDPGVVSVTERRQNQKKAVFDIKPVSQGNAHIEFRLKEALSEYTYDIRIDLFVDPENHINIIGSSHFDRTPEFVPVSGSDAEYAIAYDGSDAMRVLIRSANAPEWAADSLNPEVFGARCITQFSVIENDAVSESDAASSTDVVSGSEPAPVVYIDTGYVEFEVYGYTEGTGTLRFSNTASGAGFELYIYVDTVGTVASVSAQELDEIEAERLLEQAEREAEIESGYYSADYFDDLNDQFIQSLIDQQAAEQNAASGEEQPVETEPTAAQPTETQPAETQPTEELPPEEQPVVA